MPRPRKKPTVVEAPETIESMTEDIKAEKAEGSKVTEEKKAEPRKAASRKTSTKTKETQEKAAKEPAGKTAARGRAKKAEQQCSLYVQYAGKSYSEEDLMKMAKEIWKRDLKRKVGDLSSVSLYVKTEENKVYYVMNDEVTGSFDI